MASMETTSFEQWLEAQGFNKKSINKFIEEDFTQSSELMRLNKDDILSLKLTLAQQKILESLIEPREKQGVIETVESQTKANVEETEEDITTEDMSPMSLTVEDSCQSQQVAEMATDDMETLQAKKTLELRVVITGDVGSGKSSTGNTIIGEKIFHTGLSSKSSRTSWRSFTCSSLNRKMKIVDTQELAPEGIGKEDMLIEQTSSAGDDDFAMHAILFVMKIGRFLEHDKVTIDRFIEYWGRDALKYVVVVFTNLDEIDDEETTLDEFLSKSDPRLRVFLSDTNNRYIAVNNKRKSNTSFVKEIQKQIFAVITENKGRRFVNKMLRTKTVEIYERETMESDTFGKVFKRGWLKTCVSAMATLFCSDVVQLVVVTCAVLFCVNCWTKEGVRDG